MELNGRRSRLSDFFITYYDKNSIHIVYVKGLKHYYLLGNTGQIADSSVIYSLTKEDADRLIAGKISVSDIMRREGRGLNLSNYERYFSEKDWEELARLSDLDNSF